MCIEKQYLLGGKPALVEASEVEPVKVGEGMYWLDLEIASHGEGCEPQLSVGWRRADSARWPARCGWCRSRCWGTTRFPRGQTWSGKALPRQGTRRHGTSARCSAGGGVDGPPMSGVGQEIDKGNRRKWILGGERGGMERSEIARSPRRRVRPASAAVEPLVFYQWEIAKKMWRRL